MKLSLSLSFTATLFSFSLAENILEGCVDPADFDPSVDLFPDKAMPVSSENWDISYHNYYKIVTNNASNESYLLYQCGTEVSDELREGHEAVIPVPVQNGVGFTSTPQLPHLEQLGVRDEIVAYIGNPSFISSSCVNELIDDETIHVLQNASDPAAVEALIDSTGDVTPSVIFTSPWNALSLENQVKISASTESSNAAVYEWSKVFAAFFNLEAKANDLFEETIDRYNCVESNAAIVATDSQEQQPTILWAYYSTYNSGWDVAKNCPNNYYCEFAAACSANILHSTEGSVETPFGNVKTLEEFVEFGKDADMWIFPSGDWNDIFATNKDALEEFKSVKNQKVFDYQGVGENAWFSERLAEPDVVLQDFCAVAGMVSAAPPVHQRRWFRNVFTEDPGTPPTCDDVSAPLVTGATECVELPAVQGGGNGSSSTTCALSFSVVVSSVAVTALSVLA